MSNFFLLPADCLMSMAARHAGKRFVERSNQIIWHRCKGHLLSLSSDFLCRRLAGQKHFPVFLLRPMPRRRFEPHLECFSPILKLSDLKGALGRGWNWPDDFSLIGLQSRFVLPVKDYGLYSVQQKGVGPCKAKICTQTDKERRRERENILSLIEHGLSL